jgi:hypothetical protein
MKEAKVRYLVWHIRENCVLLIGRKIFTDPGKRLGGGISRTD